MIMAFGPIDHEPVVVNFECAARDGFVVFGNVCGHGVLVRLVKRASRPTGCFFDLARNGWFDVGAKQAGAPVPDRLEAIITPTCVINGLLAEMRRNVRAALQGLARRGRAISRGAVLHRWDSKFPTNRCDGNGLPPALWC